MSRAEALSGNCCQKRRTRTVYTGSTIPPASGSYISKPATTKNAHVGARNEWKDTLLHHQFTCGRRSLFSCKKERIIYIRGMLIHSLWAVIRSWRKWHSLLEHIEKFNVFRSLFISFHNSLSLSRRGFQFRKLSQVSLTNTRRSRP